MNRDSPEQQALIRALTRLEDSPTPSALAGGGENEQTTLFETMIAFVFGEYAFIIDSATRCDLATDLSPSSVPLSPPLFTGIVNLHGQLLSTYRAPGAQADAYLFVSGEGDDRVGLFIEQKPTMVRIKTSDFFSDAPSDPQISPACAGQAVRLGNRLHYLTDATRLGPWLREWSQQLAREAVKPLEAPTSQ